MNKAITLCRCSSFLWGAKAVREFILYMKKMPIIFTSFFLPNIVNVCNIFLYHQIKIRLIRSFLHTVFFASFNTWSAPLANEILSEIYCFQVSHFNKLGFKLGMSHFKNSFLNSLTFKNNKILIALGWRGSMTQNVYKSNTFQDL